MSDNKTAPCARIPMNPQNSRPMVTSQMKADCIGEFEFTIQDACGECIDTGADEDCEVCQGGIEYERKVTVPWNTCKQIYKRMAESAAAGFTQSNEQGDYREYLEWAESVIEELDPHGIGIYPEDLAKAAMALPSHGITQLAVPKGWKLVPIQMTDEMWDAVRAGQSCTTDLIWKRALEAAPEPPPYVKGTEQERQCSHCGGFTDLCDDCGYETNPEASGQKDSQLTECDWCHEKYPDEMLQNETQSGDSICNSCVEKLDRDEGQRNSFGGPA